MKDEWSFEILGTTQDDAIGEAYDKVSRVMGTGYPGGPVIDKMAKLGHPHYTLPKPKTEKPLDFSFSGLKSAVLQLIDRESKKGEELNKEDLSYAFQEAALDTLLKKTMQAVREFKPKQVVLAGGVAANSRLRRENLGDDSGNAGGSSDDSAVMVLHGQCRDDWRRGMDGVYARFKRLVGHRREPVDGN